MRRIYNQFISFMLFICIVFSGMCTRDSGTDFLFKYTAAHLEQFRMESVDAKIYNCDGCTIETMASYADAFIINAAKRSGDSNNRAMSQFLLYTFLGTNTNSNAYAAVNIINIPKPHKNTVILKYIHNKDGKK